MVTVVARSILFSPLWTSQLWDTLCRLQQEGQNPKKAHTVCSMTPWHMGERWVNQKGPNTGILWAQLSPVCADRTCLCTSFHQKAHCEAEHSSSWKVPWWTGRKGQWLGFATHPFLINIMIKSVLLFPLPVECPTSFHFTSCCQYMNSGEGTNLRDWKREEMQRSL